MVDAITSSENPPAGRAGFGVCVLAKFPEMKLRAALRQGGHDPVFWHHAADAAVAAFWKSDLDLFLLGSQRANSIALACVSSLIEKRPSAKIVLICERTGSGDARDALDAGACAIVPLSDIDKALMPVIEAVRAGQVSVPGAARNEAGRRALTTREKQILGQVVLGITNAEIAAKLFLAESTVKSHLSSAFAKLGVTSRHEAASLILNPASRAELGMLTVPAEETSTSR